MAAILSAPRPTSKKQIRAFLGLAGYYRCFIPNFSSLATALTDLTKKGQPEMVKWGPKEEEAFNRVKAALTSEPVLRAPDFNSSFLVQTDASDTGVGAVLSQVQDGEEHPVVYISRKLSTTEQRYAAVEKEALAVKWAVLELKYYLLGRKFTLITDHAPLQWMARAKDTNARVTRWFLALQDFHFDVRHRAGTAYANADGLSRLWAAFAGLSGVFPPPAPTFPLARGTRTRQRRKFTCMQSPRTDRSQLRLLRRGLQKPQQHRVWGGETTPEGSRLMFVPISFQKAVDRSARHTSTGHRTHRTRPAGEQDHDARKNHHRHVGTITSFIVQ